MRSRHAHRAVVILLIAALLATGMAALGCDTQARVRGSGTPATAERPVSGFDTVEVSGALDVRVTRAPAFSVKVTADDNIVPLILTERRDNTLQVRTKGGQRYDALARQPRIEVTMPSITRLEATGASTITASGVDAPSLDIEASGASTVEATGRAERLELNASAASRLRLADLIARTAEVRASGASSIEVQVSDTLAGQVSGASSVQYRGQPRLSVESSGASSVRAR
jgi:Putative auto-transporter adhesin, head GIN domain